MEAKAQLGRDIGVGLLFARQDDVQADALATRFMSAAVTGFHDARSAAGGDIDRIAALDRDPGDDRCKAARLLVISAHFQLHFCTLDRSCITQRQRFAQQALGLFSGNDARAAEDHDR